MSNYLASEDGKRHNIGEWTVWIWFHKGNDSWCYTIVRSVDEFPTSDFGYSTHENAIEEVRDLYRNYNSEWRRAQAAREALRELQDTYLVDRRHDNARVAIDNYLNVATNESLTRLFDIFSAARPFANHG